MKGWMDGWMRQVGQPEPAVALRDLLFRCGLLPFLSSSPLYKQRATFLYTALSSLLSSSSSCCCFFVLFCFFTLFLVRDDLLLESGSAAAAAAALLMKLLPRRRWPVPKIQNIVEFNNIKVAQDETVDSCGRCVVEIQVCGARGGRRGGGQGQKLRSTSESSPAAAVAGAAASITKA